MEYFLTTATVFKRHSSDFDEKQFTKQHLVKAESEELAENKVQKYYKDKSDPYGGFVYTVLNVEVEETL